MDNMKVIYAMVHRETRKFYIGSTRDLSGRKAMWKINFAVGKTNRLIKAVSTKYGDWEFRVLEKCDPNIGDPEMELREKHAIERAFAAAPQRLLNVSRVTTRNGGNYQGDRPSTTVSRSTYYLRLRNGMTPEQAEARGPGHPLRGKVLVLGIDGTPMLHALAAEFVGCSEDTLGRRLAKLRKKKPPVLSIEVVELKRRSDEAKKYWRKT